MRDEWRKKCAGLALLVIAASVAYYFVIFLPRERTARLEMEHQERLATEQREGQRLDVERQQKLAADQIGREKLELQRQRLDMELRDRIAVEERRSETRVLLNACLRASYVAYEKTWEDACVNLEGRKYSCLLPKAIAGGIENAHADAKADCFKQNALLI